MTATLALFASASTSCRLALFLRLPYCRLIPPIWLWLIFLASPKAGKSHIQYSRDDFKLDRAGHKRQCRQAEERVILAALAVWPDGSYEILHYEVSEGEGEAQWNPFFQQMIDRGLTPEAVKLVVSDGTLGLLKSLKQHLPQAQQQRCIIHKVRGMEAVWPDGSYEILHYEVSEGEGEAQWNPFFQQMMTEA